MRALDRAETVWVEALLRGDTLAASAAAAFAQDDAFDLPGCMRRHFDDQVWCA
jgi:hypothetical protein